MGDTQLISKLTSKSQTVVPRAVRQRLGLNPGDHIRYRMTGRNVVLERLAPAGISDDPFFAFDEWASDKDDRAFKDL